MSCFRTQESGEKKSRMKKPKLEKAGGASKQKAAKDVVMSPPGQTPSPVPSPAAAVIGTAVVACSHCSSSAAALCWAYASAVALLAERLWSKESGISSDPCAVHVFYVALTGNSPPLSREAGATDKFKTKQSRKRKDSSSAPSSQQRFATQYIIWLYMYIVLVLALSCSMYMLKVLKVCRSNADVHVDCSDSCVCYSSGSQGSATYARNTTQPMTLASLHKHGACALLTFPHIYLCFCVIFYLVGCLVTVC